MQTLQTSVFPINDLCINTPSSCESRANTASAPTLSSCLKSQPFASQNSLKHPKLGQIRPSPCPLYPPNSFPQ